MPGIVEPMARLRRSALLLLALAACRKEASAPADGGADGGPREAPSAVATATPRPSRAPRYRAIKSFPGDTGFWGVGSAIVACEGGCKIALEGPRTWLVTADDVVEDRTLSPRRPDLIGNRLRFFGKYPDAVYAIYQVNRESGAEYDVGLRYALRGQNHFVRAELPEESDRGRFLPGLFSPPIAVPGPEHKAALSSYVFPRIGTQPVLAGHGGPLLVLEDKKLGRWDGGAWTSTPAPWGVLHDLSAARLVDGATLVASEGLHWISKDGDAVSIDLETPSAGAGVTGVKLGEVLERDDDIWVVARSSTAAVLLAPESPAALRRTRAAPAGR